MTVYIAFALSVFVLSIIEPLAFKVTSMKLPHDTAAIFMAAWVLIGLALTAPYFWPLAVSGWQQGSAQPFVLALLVAKGLLFYYMMRYGQELTSQSLSTSNYVGPASLGGVALINGMLGEHLTSYQIVVATALCLSGLAFAMFGHMRDLTPRARMLFFLLIPGSILLSNLDHFCISATNWYFYLLVSCGSMLGFCLILTRQKHIWSQALISREGLITGVIFAVFELVKFYPAVTVISVTVLVTLSIAAQACVLVLCALIWHERHWTEQAIWGLLAFGLSLPLISGY